MTESSEKSNDNVELNPGLNHLDDTELCACLMQDLDMLEDGSWVPDKHSIDATRDVIMELYNRLWIERQHGYGIR